MKRFMKRWQRKMYEQKSWKAAFNVMETLINHGYEAVIVGGAVRDLLRGHLVHDVDVATNAHPEEVKALFSNTADVGIAHGTVLVIHKLSPIEVTTYRTEGQYQDHRRPDEVKFVSSLSEDLKRRDFTINAMALTIHEEIIDLYGGKEDMERHIIRAVGEPTKRFKEDALRMLRAIRFSAQLGFQIEINTLEAIKKQAEDICFIAKERIKQEFDKIFISRYPKNAFLHISNSSLSQFLPGDYSHYEAWECFKPNGKSVKGWAFLTLLQPNHDASILSQLKCSNSEKKYVKAVVEAFQLLNDGGWTKRDYFDYDVDILETAYEFACQLNKNVKAPASQYDIVQIKSSLAIQSQQELAVSGQDLIKWSGQKGGPWLKEMLDRILNEILENRLSNSTEQIKEWFLREHTH